MKSGSTTSKNIGQSVVAGEYLGIVGSSGSSTAPHLHLEVYDANGNLNDPFQGTCNTMNANSWWSKQAPYYQPQINKLTTGPAAAQFSTCPNPGTSNEKKTLFTGTTTYFTAYFRDQLDDEPATYRITKPDGSIYDQWQHTSNQAHYSDSYWYWYSNNFTQFPGIWNYSVTYKGKQYDYSFYVVESCGSGSPTYIYSQDIGGFLTYSTASSIKTLGTSAPVNVLDGGNLTLLAKNGIVLKPGFAVKDKGVLRATVNPDVCSI